MDSTPLDGDRSVASQPGETTPATESSSSTTAALASSGDGGSTFERLRYDTPPQNASELGAINSPYEMIGYHQTYIPVHIASDQRVAKRFPIAYHPVQVSYPHHLSNGYAAPRIEYLRAPRLRNPYITRADEIGVYHNIPGVGHLGLDLVPPKPWKAGDDPVNPEEASYLFEKSRETARIEHERLDIASMSEEAKAKSHEAWLRNLRKHELILHHRLDIWNEFIEEKQAISQRLHHQSQSNFGLAYYPKPYQYLHPLSQTTNSQQQYQSMEPSGDLPSPSGLDPYLIRQSVESAINRFQDQQSEMELKRLQSEKQLGNVLDHFKDHIGKTPSASPQNGASAVNQVVPVNQEDETSAQRTLASPTIGAPAVSSSCGGHFAMPLVYGAFDLDSSHGSYNLPLPQTVHDQSPVVATSYIPNESRNTPGWSPIRSSFDGNEVYSQDAAHDPLFSTPVHPQSISQSDSLSPIHEVARPDFISTDFQMANRWTQSPQQAGGAVEPVIEGSPGRDGSSNVEQYQDNFLHSGMHQGLSLGMSHYAEMGPATGTHGREKGATTKLEKTTSRAPRKKKKETWYNQYIRGIKHPTNIPSKEYMETTLADAQLARDAKPRARGRRATPKFDERKGFPVKQSLANDMLKRGVIQASYVNTKPVIAGTVSPGVFGGGNQLIANATTTGGIVQGFAMNGESAIRIPTATDRDAQEVLTDSGGLITYPRGNDEALPKTMLFSTALSKPEDLAPLVRVPILASLYLPIRRANLPRLETQLFMPTA
ncbi:MAG: hypothetical protein M1813_007574 [Trichoglossum hirsutum]|nr:MAG: hypothetical protein M1813_007574 [Trichoglossum hirsutum]